MNGGLLGFVARQVHAPASMAAARPIPYWGYIGGEIVGDVPGITIWICALAQPPLRTFAIWSLCRPSTYAITGSYPRVGRRVCYGSASEIRGRGGR